MKKKFNLKLTAFLVSLLISLILFIFGAQNNMCIGFACIILAVSFVLFSFYLTERTNNIITQTDMAIEEEDEEELDENALFQVEIEKSKLIKSTKRTKFVVYFSAVLLVIMGILAMI